MSGSKDADIERDKEREFGDVAQMITNWRLVGFAVVCATLLVPMIWYWTAVRGSSHPRAEVDWLDGSVWRITEIENREMPTEAALTFAGGQMTIEATGCAPRRAGYRLTAQGIVLTLPAAIEAAPTCGDATANGAWARLPQVRGVSRSGSGLALTDKAGRGLVRMRR